MSAKPNAPIIIKRKKIVGGDGHHGGAWKVAYADFVTAMMAFFMLMWLLNATTEKQRKGIADYFSPTIPVNRISGGGDGSFGGDSVFSDETLSQNGAGRTGGYPAPMDATQSTSSGGKAADPLQEVADMLSGRGGESALPDETLRHIVTRVTDEGLIIEVFDTSDTPLFADGGAVPTRTMEVIAEVLVDVFATVNNEVAVNGPHSVPPDRSQRKSGLGSVDRPRGSGPYAA